LLLPPTIPAQQASHGKGVAQIMQAWARLFLLPAQLLTQCTEGVARLPIAQGLAVLVEEKRPAVGLGKRFGADLPIVVDGRGGTGGQRHVAGLANLDC
jgi:hypothetical protein